MRHLLLVFVLLTGTPLLAQYSCGNTRTWADQRCQQAAFGQLSSTWSIISRHGEYAQSETECNVPGQVSVSNGVVTITTVHQSTTCGDFNTDGSTRTTPASWPYTTGDMQWTSFSFQYGTITFRAKYPNSNTSLWPSHWLLSTNCQLTNLGSGDVGFSGCPNTSSASYQEIDMIECYNSLSWCSTNVYTGGNGSWHTCHMTPGMDTNWHTYAFTRTATSVSMFIDGQDSGCTTTSGDYSSFPTAPMFMIIQTQTGGVAGTPSNANLPASLQTDFVRVQDSQGHTTFFDDFQPPVPPMMLRPLARMARLTGGAISPGAAAIVVNGQVRFQGATAIQ